MNTKSSRKMSNKKITGQGMSEYLVIVGLLAVAGIATMGFMGGSVRQTMSAFAGELSGAADTDVETMQSNAQANANAASAAAVSGLDNYEDMNDGLEGATKQTATR